MHKTNNNRWCDGTNRRYKEKLCCSEKTKDMILKDCLREFLDHNPEYVGEKITQDFLLKRIAMHYLDMIPPKGFE